MSDNDFYALLKDHGLEHYGVPGMRWGYRRANPSGKSASALLKAKDTREKFRMRANEKKAKAKAKEDEQNQVKVKGKPGQKVTAEGGKRQPAAADAIAAAISKQKAKSSSTDALSTAELKALVERMNLEQQYSKLNPPTKKLGRRLIDDFIVENGKKELNSIGQEVAKAQIQKVLGSDDIVKQLAKLGVKR